MSDETISVELFNDRSEPNSTVFVLGATGCGKTTLMANLLKQRQRFVIVDTREEYPPQFFGNHVKVCKTIHEFVDALNAPTERIIVRPPGTVDDEWFMDLLCYQLIEFQKLNPNCITTFSTDEFNRFVTPLKCPNGLRELVQRGRGHHVEKIFGAQWFNTIPTWARDSFSEIYVFRHSEPRGLAMLAAYGFNPDAVNRLPPHTVLHMNAGQVKEYKLTASKNTQTYQT